MADVEYSGIREGGVTDEDDTIIAEGRGISVGPASRWMSQAKLGLAAAAAALLILGAVATAVGHGALQASIGHPQRLFSQARSEVKNELYECFDEPDNWKTAWSDMKKQWCCQHESQGCKGETKLAVRVPVQTSPGMVTEQKDQVTNFNCEEGYENWQRGWSSRKKSFCCDSAQRGCDSWSLSGKFFWIALATGICGLLFLVGLGILLYNHSQKKKKMKLPLQPLTKRDDGRCCPCGSGYKPQSKSPWAQKESSRSCCAFGGNK
mmetsp:Transcript_55341/g.157251  ORF Transcript_55341/g.157251 Transcript_55341/m.157251 type:complete len:264 (-) Transcript_55341:52-843(-)